MDQFKLKVKIGLNEFEAEGPEASVKAQFALWREAIAGAPAAAAPSVMNPGIPTDSPFNAEQLAKVFKYDPKQKMVTLHIKPKGDSALADAVLLLTFGYKFIGNQERATVRNLKPSISMSGFVVDRIDRAATPHVKSAMLHKGGVGKGGHYTLTNAGLKKATELIQGMLST